MSQERAANSPFSMESRRQLIHYIQTQDIDGITRTIDNVPSNERWNVFTNTPDFIPLQLAAAQGVDVFKLLVNYGFSLSHRTVDGQTALHVAASAHNYSILNCLKQIRGFSSRMLVDCDDNGMNVFHHLLSANTLVDVDEVNVNGAIINLLLMLFDTSALTLAHKNHPLFDQLEKSGVFNLAIYSGYESVCDTFLKIGFNPFLKQNCEGWMPPFHIAARCGRASVLKNMVETQHRNNLICPISMSLPDNSTPLSLAYKHGHVEATYYLCLLNAVVLCGSAVTSDCQASAPVKARLDMIIQLSEYIVRRNGPYKKEYNNIHKFRLSRGYRSKDRAYSCAKKTDAATFLRDVIGLGNNTCLDVKKSRHYGPLQQGKLGKLAKQYFKNNGNFIHRSI